MFILIKLRSSELVSVSQIESLAKRQKMDKEARIESIKVSRPMLFSIVLRFDFCANV